LIPELNCPDLIELDILRYESIEAAMNRYKPRVVVHAAAYTDVAGAEQEKKACWETNVVGTRNMVQALREKNVVFIYISTDYVFAGDRGNYSEEDAVGPVRNYYALSKLAAEEVARVHRRHLILRTSFRPRQWPYPVAFTDVYTSQDYVDVIAPEIGLAILHAEEIPYETLHIATERKSVYELARRRKPDVQAGTKRDAIVELPDDISLNTERWQQLKTVLMTHKA
jgi:dTDP-4-dehydrorhamnose reductase